MSSVNGGQTNFFQNLDVAIINIESVYNLIITAKPGTYRYPVRYSALGKVIITLIFVKT
jgi:hypothetical protein